LIRTGKKQDVATMTIFAEAPNPNQMMISGASAIFGRL